MRQNILLIALVVVVLAVGAGVIVRTRLATCQSVPLLADERLPNATLAGDAGAKMPRNWTHRDGANGVELRGPAIDGQGFALTDGRALQLLGINNYVQTPPIAVSAGQSYCFTGRALTDNATGTPTRLRAVFRWLDGQGALLGEDASAWLPVVLWRPALTDWSPLGATFRAPEGATTLLVRVQPAADDRIYLDDMHARWTATDVTDQSQATEASVDQSSVKIQPWPNGYKAALSFSFDWETTMGGLIHTRSALSDDPNNAEDPTARGLRMRQGVTTTLDLFRPYGIQATYYATGYNFLPGNTERQTFMGDPTFAWATPEHGWKTDWSQRPWFSTDPYGTVQSSPDYYFGDLVPQLQAEKQAIESHTFSHLYGGYASPEQWRDDIFAWETAALDRGVLPPRSLAFPWSSSAGMSDASWQEFEDTGITSITRTNWSQRQYQLADRENWQCQPLPARPTILACPDFYLLAGRIVDPSSSIAQAHAGGDAAQAIAQIDRAIAAGGMIDVWSHTEEAVSPEQIADWRAVVQHAAQQRDAGALWVAPMTDIAGWQTELKKLKVMSEESEVGDSTAPLRFTVVNEGRSELQGVTLQLPFVAEKMTVNGEQQMLNSQFLTVTVQAGQRIEVLAWPA